MVTVPCPRVGDAPGKGASSTTKSLENLGKTKGPAFALARFPLCSSSTAHGFPNPLIVSENPSKSLEIHAKTAFRWAHTVTVPWPCLGGAPGNGVSSTTKSLKPLGKTKGPAFALAPFPLCSSSTANGFPARKWFPKILQNHWKIMQTQHFRVCSRPAAANCQYHAFLIVHRKRFPCPRTVSKNPSKSLEIHAK